MKTAKRRIKGIPELLHMSPTDLKRIRHTIMFSVFQAYVKTGPNEPVDVTAISRSLLTTFSGNDLVIAAYIYGVIEQELNSTENYGLLEDLKSFASIAYEKTDITYQQFNLICNGITTYYKETHRI